MTSATQEHHETEAPDRAGEAVTIRGLVKVYPGGIRAVDGVDLDIHRGELFGLLGPNGAGKTTTVGMCTTRIRPTAGAISVEGVDVTREPARVKRRVGVVTQFNTLDRSLTLWENIYYHCLFFGLPTHQAHQRADRLLEQFRLADRSKAFPDEISGGMAQRLQVARSIAHHPHVLFLDEPTAGLDPQSRLALWEAIEELRREGITVLLTTHYMEEADSLCDRVAIIDHGRILVNDSPAALKRSLGAETVVEIRLERTDDDLLGRLAELPGAVSVDATESGARLMVSSHDGMLPRIVELAQGYGLHDVSVTPPTLETVFINLTGRDLRE